MIPEDRNPGIYIFTGHYGTGKTELAVNFAAALKKLHPGRNVAICDMDIVNPFFRTADAARPLEDMGVMVELPLYANSNVDVPALTPRMEYLIREKDWDLVLDIGGDDVGAKAVSRYAEAICSRPYELYFVLNANRPFTRDLAGAQKSFSEVQASCGLDFTGIVNNTHLLQFTTPESVEEGAALAVSLSEATGVPFVFSSAFAAYAQKNGPAPELVAGRPLFLMEEYIRLLWNRSDSFS